MVICREIGSVERLACTQKKCQSSTGIHGEKNVGCQDPKILGTLIGNHFTAACGINLS